MGELEQPSDVTGRKLCDENSRAKKEETGSPTRSPVPALESLCSDCYTRKINIHLCFSFAQQPQLYLN